MKNFSFRMLAAAGIFLAAALMAASVRAESFGAESNPTGNPIGGGTGYSDILTPGSVVADLKADGKVEVLKELLEALAASNPNINKEDFLTILMERERLGSTGVGDGVAIPHGKIHGSGQMMAAFGRKKSGIDFEALDGKSTKLFFLLMAPENSAGAHLKALARISRLLKQEIPEISSVESAD